MKPKKSNTEVQLGWRLEEEQPAWVCVWRGGVEEVHKTCGETLILQGRRGHDRADES